MKESGRLMRDSKRSNKTKRDKIEKNNE